MPYRDQSRHTMPAGPTFVETRTRGPNVGIGSPFSGYNRLSAGVVVNYDGQLFGETGVFRPDARRQHRGDRQSADMPVGVDRPELTASH